MSSEIAIQDSHFFLKIHIFPVSCVALYFAGFVVTCLLLTLTDSLYYGDLTLQKLYTFEGLEWSDWKCTPAAYIMHNFVPGGGASSNAPTAYKTFTSVALHAVKSLCFTFGPLGKYKNGNVPLLLKIGFLFIFTSSIVSVVDKRGQRSSHN